MKKEIQATPLKDEDFSFDEIMLCVEKIRKDGNSFIIKLDGMRPPDASQYTVVISFSSNAAKDVIRADSNTLKEAFLSVLKQYFHGHKPIAKHTNRVSGAGFMDQSQKEIEVILSKDKELSFNEIMLCAEQIRKEGNIFFIGLDEIGPLHERQYIVEVIVANNTEKNNAKADYSTLKEACLSVIKQYLYTKSLD